MNQMSAIAQPPTGALRWEPPVPFISTRLQNVTTLGPSCLQQFPFASSALDQFLFNNPADPPAENEDCLFLNVWAPASQNRKLPVLPLSPAYDGTSFAANQEIILVTFNYRTNVFGFPELAFLWVQDNIANFGGDPDQVTIMGQSAGSQSVSSAISRHTSGNAPFRAGIMLSGAQVSMVPIPSFTSFNNFSTAVGCTQAPGPGRLACLKQVPAATIRNFTNGPASGSFAPVVDDVTVFSDPLQRIHLSAFLTTTFAGLVTADQVRPLYPGLNDSQIISEIIKDAEFLCPAELWSGAAVGAGVANARFLRISNSSQALGRGTPLNALPEIFGTFIAATATPAEATLSHTMQTLVANFVKNPTVAPAPNWPKYVPGNRTTTLAKLAYSGNVEANNVVQSVQSDSIVRD
ncbi:liver carboxylesterase-like protein 1 precursor [Mycena olivaceomarginata]|nr:liver carboxylesterase-like protein 1 precursor [Mycena olivaceomarginata]